MILYLPIRKLLARRATTVIGAIPPKLNVQSLTTCADGIEDFSITILIPALTIAISSERRRACLNPRKYSF